MKHLKTLCLIAAVSGLSACQTMKSATSAVGDMTGDETMSMAKNKMSPDQVQQIGHDMSAALIKKYPLVENDKITLYLNRVGQYVALHLDNGAKNIKCSGGKEKLLPYKGFRFAAIQSDEKLAMSLPGGYVFVSTGFLKDMKTEDELAGVLAHEATHVVCQDGMTEVENAALKQGVAKAAGAGASLMQQTGTKLDVTGNSDVDGALTDEAGDAAKNLIAKAYEKFFQNPFSRGQEKLADRGALLAIYRGGYFPNDYIGLTDALKEDTSARHPGSADRVAWLKHDYLKMQKKGVVDTKKTRVARFADFKKSL
ncbi:M48 family metalloprotease [soil metagenome]